MDVVIAIAAVIADPPLVHVRILPRLDAVDVILILFGKDRAAGRAVRADLGMPLHEPDALRVEEILVPQRTDRAEIDDIARQLVLQRKALDDVDLFVSTTIDDEQLARTTHFAREADTASAHHTAVDEQRDRITDVAATAGEGSDIGAAFFLAVLEVVILEVALARLVADRAIDRVIDQQCFFDKGSTLLDLVGVGDEDGSLFRRRLAGGDELGEHRDRAGLGISISRSRPGTSGNWLPRSGRGASNSGECRCRRVQPPGCR